MDGSSPNINSILVSILFGEMLRFMVFSDQEKENQSRIEFFHSLAPSADEESNGAKPFLIVYFLINFFSPCSICKDKVALD